MIATGAPKGRRGSRPPVPRTAPSDEGAPAQRVRERTPDAPRPPIPRKAFSYEEKVSANG